MRFILPKPEWKSQWRKDFESYLAIERAKPRTLKLVSLPKPPAVRTRRVPPRFCSLCSKLICRRNTSGKCYTCFFATFVPKIPVKPEPRHCMKCNKVIRSHAELDLCREHGINERRQVQRERARLRMRRNRMEVDA